MAGLIQSRNPVAMGVVNGIKARFGEKIWSRTYGPKIDALMQQGASKAPQQGASEQPQQSAAGANSSDGGSAPEQSENGSTMLTGSESTTLGGGRMKKKTLLGG